MTTADLDQRDRFPALTFRPGECRMVVRHPVDAQSMIDHWIESDSHTMVMSEPEAPASDIMAAIRAIARGA